MYLEHIDTYVFFLDTEGYIANDNIKESVLTILLIISSLVMINLKNESDYAEDLAIFQNVLKKICIFYDDNQEDLNTCLAKTMMIQRDFDVNLKISTIENLLTAYDIFEDSNKTPFNLENIKNILQKLFLERDYMVCSQPILENNLLESLILDVSQKVTEEFNHELNKIRDKLLYHIRPKCLFKINMKTKLMGYFIKNLVNDINENYFKESNNNKSILISSCWKNAIEESFEDAFHEACDYYYDEMQRFFLEDKPRKRMILFRLLCTMREEVSFNYSFNFFKNCEKKSRL